MYTQPPKLRRLRDRSIVDEEGRFIYFSESAFMDKVVSGGGCFICAREIENKSKEHIFPKWMLKFQNLFGEVIRLPNGTQYRYSGYKLPCCVDCNSALGRIYEVPVGDAFRDGFEGVMRLARSDPLTIFGWFNLMFLKTHLRDNSLKEDRAKADSRQIGERHVWENFRAAHMLIRAPLFGTYVSPTVLGSLFVFRVRDYEEKGSFDYQDHSSMTVFLRINDVAVICVLNDFGEVNRLAGPHNRFSGTPDLVHTAEFLSRCQAANASLTNRLMYRNVTDFDAGECVLTAFAAEAEPEASYSRELYGKILWDNFQPFLDWRVASGGVLADMEDEIKAGNVSFLGWQTAAPFGRFD